MKKPLTILAVLASLLAGLCFASLAVAQDNQFPQARGIYLAGRHPEIQPKAGSANLTAWKGGFTDLTHTNRHFIMVGTDPNHTNTTTTVPVVIVPIKMVYGKNNGNKTFDPMTHKLPNGQTVMQMILASPIFNANVDFKQGGTDLGKTQYIDAFQRGNFWGKNIKTNNKYHVLLGKPTVLPEQTIKVPQGLGVVTVNPLSGHGLIGTFDFNTMDNTIQTYIKKFKQIQPNTLPIFISYDIYLGNGTTCGCVGGYHFLNGGPPTGQTYSYTTSLDQGTNEFAQDVSALSHEIGEWMDDPFFGSNTVGCQDNSQLEVGDPLEGRPNGGAFPYKVGNFTYNLQSLVWLGYFGAPRSTSLHKWLSFQNDEKSVCPGQ
jgi:hypothetical protein